MQDISPSNFLLSCGSGLEKPRLLVADFELAVLFPDGVDPIVDIWDRFMTPPEGKKAIHAFAFDMYCVGSFFTSYLKVRKKMEEGLLAVNVSWA